jgi:hypothetical protein
MGFSWLLFLSLAASDLVFWLLGLTPALDRWDPVSLARVQAVASLCLGTAVGLFSIRAALRPPALRRTEIVLSRWPQALDGFRILQLSDVHIGQVLGRRFAAGVVERCNRSKPDLIALTGDLVDGGVDRLREEVLPFARLRARHGVFFVTGNHDYYSGADPWVECLQGLGLRALRNERVAIGEGDTVFELAGVDDRHGKLFGEGQGEDLEQALLGRDPDRAVVLLAHQPLGFREAAGMGVDLQISGHTHGGQIWPFGYIVRLFTPYVAGHYRVNGSQLYVSRGTGFWGPPMRFLAPAEITEIVLRSSKP